MPNSRSTSMSGRKRTATSGGVARGRGASGSAAAPDDAVDSSSHAGLVNIGNSCYANSVLQATGATKVLRELFQGSDVLDAAASSSGTSHDMAISRLRSPAIRVADEERGRATPATPYAPILSSPPYQPSAADLPLGSAFRYTLESLWAASTREGTRAAAINPKPLINKLASKFDQYGDRSQQDGHELLRHLLDAIRMEELDLVKKLQPPQSTKRKRRHSMHDQASNALATSPIPRPLTTANIPGPSKTEQMTLDPTLSALTGPESLPPDLQSMLPFVDILFCGKLASMVICESCKHISHTEEDFLDISLSVKPEEPRAKKRDRFKSMADRWRKATLRPPSRPVSALDMRSSVVSPISDADASDAGGSTAAPSDVLSGGEEKEERGRFHLRKTSLHKKSSKRGKGKGGLADSDADVPDMPDMASMMLAPVAGTSTAKSSGSSSEDLAQRSKDLTMSTTTGGAILADPVPPTSNGHTTPVSLNASANAYPRSAHSSVEVVPAKANGQHAAPIAKDRKEGVRLSPAQAAYIGKLFADLPAPSPAAALLQRLQGPPASNVSTFGDVALAAMGSSSSSQSSQHQHTRLRWFGDAFHTGHASNDALAIIEAQSSTGLVQALRNFTAVEALEGENAFACKRCYRIQHPLSEAERREARTRRANRRMRAAKGAEEERGDEESSSSDSESDLEDAADLPSGALIYTTQAVIPQADAVSISSRSSSGSSRSSVEEITEAMYASTVSAPGDLGQPISTPASSNSTSECVEESMVDAKHDQGTTLLAPIPRRPGPLANVDFDKTATPRSAGAVLRSAQAAALRDLQGGDEAGHDDDGGAEGEANGHSPAIPHIRMTEPDPAEDDVQEEVPGTGTDSFETSTDAPQGLGLQVNANARQKLSAPKARIGALHLGPPSSGSESDVGESSGYDTGDDETDASRPVDGAASVGNASAPSEVGSTPSLRRSRANQSIARRALKRYLISSAPPVLVFHFKRFQTSTGRMGFGGGGAGSYKKFDEAVNFPEILDVGPWMAPPREEYDRSGRLKDTSDPVVLERARREAADEARANEAKMDKERKGWGWRAKSPSAPESKCRTPTPHEKHAQKDAPIGANDTAAPIPQHTRYRLYAVVVHQGSMQSGHYTSYVLSDRVRLKAGVGSAEGASSAAMSKIASNSGWVSTPGSRSATPAPATSVVRPGTAAGVHPPSLLQNEPSSSGEKVYESTAPPVPSSAAMTASASTVGSMMSNSESVSSATSTSAGPESSSAPTSLTSDAGRISFGGASTGASASDVSPAPSLLTDESAEQAGAADAHTSTDAGVDAANSTVTSTAHIPAPVAVPAPTSGGAKIEWEQTVEAREAARRTRSKERRWAWEPRGGTEKEERGAGSAMHKQEVDDGRRWVYCSDTIVRAVSIEEVLKAKAYLLFYEQI